jgi:hypothetical protein
MRDVAPQKLQDFMVVLPERVSFLDNCFGIIDGSLRGIARPIYG